MGRTDLARAFATPDGSCLAVMPRLERHAARLEQLDAVRASTNPDAVARALRTAAGLYPIDGLVLGGDGRLLARAVALNGNGAAAGSAPIRLVLELMARLRPVLGARTGIAVMLETPAALADATAIPMAAAESFVVEAVHAVAEEEPDALVLIGRVDEGDASVARRLAEHYGVPLLHLAGDDIEGDPAGVVRLTDNDFVGESVVPIAESTWLITTRGELPPQADPAVVRRVLEQLKSPTGVPA